jgi:hypothetical protein
MKKVMTVNIHEGRELLDTFTITHSDETELFRAEHTYSKDGVAPDPFECETLLETLDAVCMDIEFRYGALD